MPLILSLPLYIFLFAFFGFLFIFLIFIFIGLYRLFETASLTFTSFLTTIFVLIVSVLSLFIVWYLLQDVNWQNQITIFDSSWITHLFTFN